MKQPATPLPWELHIREEDILISHWDSPGVSRAVAVSPKYGYERFREDGPYIVHACNAYPKLVEALQQACEAAVPTGTGDINAPWYMKARALLEELGE